MLQYILWPEKFAAGIELGKSFFDEKGSFFRPLPSRVVILGMGGSGIAGRILSSVFCRHGNGRVISADPCDLPKGLCCDDLVIAVSHSGNTWEVLDAVSSFQNIGVKIIAVTSGGKLAEVASKLGFPIIKTSPDGAEPREELGRFLGILFSLMDCMGIAKILNLSDKLCRHLECVVEACSSEVFFGDFLRVLDGCNVLNVLGVSGDTEYLAHRCQAQMNENAKVLAVASCLPEAHHNLIEGLGAHPCDSRVVILSTNFLSDKLGCAVDNFCLVIEERGVKLYRPRVFGDTWEEQIFSLLIWSDFASYFLGLFRGEDVCKVAVIGELRGAIERCCGDNGS